MKRVIVNGLIALTVFVWTVPMARAGNSTGMEHREATTLNSLIEELLARNPELQALRKRYEASLARPRQDSALPDPRITAGWISNGSPLPGAGIGTEPTSNAGLQVAQDFPYPGKRNLKGGMARKEADSEGQMLRARQLSLVAQLKGAFYELRHLYDAIDILHRNQAVLRSLAKVAEARYTVGRAMQQDLIKSQVEISILENKLVLSEQRVASVEAEITALLDRPVGTQLGRPEAEHEFPELPPLGRLLDQAARSSPALRAQQAVIDGKHLAVEFARKDYYPDFGVIAGYYNMGRMKDMWEVKVQVNVPIYFWRKQRYGLEESSSRLVEAQRSYRATEQALAFRIQDQFRIAEASRKLIDLYGKRIVPQSRLALESSLASYESGTVDFLTVLSNLNTILDYELSYHEQQSAYLRALAELEELVAHPLSELVAAAGRNGTENQQ